MFSYSLNHAHKAPSPRAAAVPAGPLSVVHGDCWAAARMIWALTQGCPSRTGQGEGGWPCPYLGHTAPKSSFLVLF